MHGTHESLAGLAIESGSQLGQRSSFCVEGLARQVNEFMGAESRQDVAHGAMLLGGATASMRCLRGSATAAVTIRRF